MKISRSLEVSTPSEQEIMFTRDFDAPPRLVFEAHTNPDLVRRWMTGPDGWYFVTCDIDLRVGGGYHYVWGDGSGFEFGFRGVFREIDPPLRLVYSETGDDDHPGEALVTHILEEHDGGTRMTMTMRFESREARDDALQTGMDKGMAVGYDRLDSLLNSAGPASR